MTSTDDALDLLAGLTDHVGLWWDSATQVQRDDARAILDLDGPRRHWIGRAKGYSKSRDAAGVSAVALLKQMQSGSMGYVAASDADQAGLIRQSVASFVSNTPALSGELVVEAKRVIAPRRGTELVILAADSAGSHGLRPSWLVVDELANWPDTERHREFFDSLWAGLPKVSDSRGVIITTAGSPGHFSRRIFEAAEADPLWRLSDVQGPPPWVDAAEVESERRRMFPARFARLWQNLWTSADDAIADPADVAAACILKGPLAPEEGRRYVCTLDLGVRNDRTVAVIAHPVREGDGTRVIVDRMKVWTPRPGAPVSLDDVRAWITEFCRSYRAPLIYDPSQAYLMVEQLRRAGVICREFIFGTQSVGKLATAIMQALRGRLLTLPDDEELKSEILSVRLRETAPNVLRIDHASGSHDDRVIATAMAVYELTSGGSVGGGLIFRDLGESDTDPLGRPIKPFVSNLGIVGSTGFPAKVRRGDDESDFDPDLAGKTAPSPFV
jgi:phage terminase large subunit-like protein